MVGRATDIAGPLKLGADASSFRKANAGSATSSIVEL